MVFLKEISDALLPITIIKLILGISVIEYPLGRPRKTLGFIYSGFLFIACGVSSIINHQIYNDELGADVNTNAILFHNIFIYGNIVFHLTAIIKEWTYRTEFQQCLQNINIVNKKFESIGYREKYITLFIKIMCIATVIILGNAYVLMLTCLFYSERLWIINVFYFLSCWLLNVPLTVELHFLALISYLRGKFQQLNNLLEKLTGCDSRCTQFEKVFYYKIALPRPVNFRLGTKTTDDVKILRTAKEIHLDLVKICETVNDIFGFQLFLSIVISVALLTIVSLDIYRTFFLPLPKHQDKNVPIHVSFALCLYTIKVLAINHICYSASEEASNTELIVCELHEPTTSPEFREELDEFILQLQQNPLIFTAHEFFILNHSFIQKIVGIVTTYLVIIVQYQVQSEQS